MYLLALVGCISQRRQPFTFLSLMLIVLQLGIVGLTGADWDGRFVLTIFPFVMFYSGIGTVEAVHQWVRAFGRPMAPPERCAT